MVLMRKQAGSERPSHCGLLWIITGAVLTLGVLALLSKQSADAGGNVTRLSNLFGNEEQRVLSTCSEEATRRGKGQKVLAYSFYVESIAF